MSRRGMPRANEGEFAFAASGTCLVTAGKRYAYFGTGGGGSRIFRTRDSGHRWTVHDSAIPAAEAGGVFSLAFRKPRHGVAVGGDFTRPRKSEDTTSRTRTGKRWVQGGDVSGYRSGVHWVTGRKGTLVAVGPTGSDISRDRGRSWRRFSGAAYDSVSCNDRGVCWASGPGGRVARLRFGE